MKTIDLQPRSRILLLNALLLLCWATATQQLKAQPVSDPLPNFWRTDGLVYTIAVTNDVAYFGGDFSYIGPSSGAAGLAGVEFGEPLPGFPNLTGTLRTVVPDGVGGWYVGGSFTVRSGSSTYRNLVHVRYDNSLDSTFRPDPDGAVRALLVMPGALVVGGEFYQIATNQTSFLAFLDPATGGTNGIRIRANSVVAALSREGGTVYLGGTFSTITTYNGTQPVSTPRQRLAAVDPATGGVLPWDPGCSGGYEGVRAIAVTGTAVYVGGDFTQCGTKPRNAIASLNKTDGTANTWNPNAQLSGSTPVVNTLAVVGNVVYAGGDFTSIGARTRVRLAALQASGFGQADPNWQFDANDIVTAISAVGNDLLVAGKFTAIGGTIDYSTGQPVQTGGTARRGFARIHEGAVLSWGPEVSLFVPAIYGASSRATCWCISQQGDKMILGGDFVSFGGVNRSKIGAINLRTGAATDWNPSSDQLVRTMVTAPQGIYVGGNFANIGGKARARIAVLKYDDGSADDWDANLQNGQYIAAIALTPSSVIVGGNFSRIGGQDRYSLAELERGTAAVTAWNPQPSGVVNVLLYSEGQVYVAGNFYSISGGNQQNLALLTMKTDVSQLVKTFSPQPDAQVRTLALDGDRLYAGGDFTKISGQDRKSVAAIDPTTGRENYPLDVQLAGQGALQARTVLPLGQALYIGGVFRGAGGENRARIASVHTVFGAATGWDPGADNAVSALARTESFIVIGGEFTRLGYHGANPSASDGQSVPYLAAFSAQPSLSNLRKSSLGHYMFNIADGDGLGSTVQVQASDKITGGSWETLGTFDVLGLQDPFEDTSTVTSKTRFYRLVRRP